jgi:hypothetical protein
MIVGSWNEFENSKGSIGEKRQKAPVQVQNRYSESAAASSDSQSHDVTEADTCVQGRRSGGARFFLQIRVALFSEPV